MFGESKKLQFELNVFPLTMDTEIFKLLLQSSHLGANRATAFKELLVIPPDSTETDVAFEPRDCFVVVLQEEYENRQIVKRRCNVDSTTIRYTLLFT